MTLHFKLHPYLNQDIRADELSTSSLKKVWWKCIRGFDHEWEASPRHIERQKNEGRDPCPYCKGQRVSVTNSLVDNHPELVKEWHPTMNEPRGPHDFTEGSSKKVWWKCPNGPDHEWESPVFARVKKGSGCPYCAGKRTSVTNSLTTLLPKLAAQWHPEKNQPTTPDDVTPGSRRKAWWLCPDNPEHEWMASLNNMSRRFKEGGIGCPMCAGRAPINETRSRQSNPSSQYRKELWKRLDALRGQQSQIAENIRKLEQLMELEGINTEDDKNQPLNQI